MATLLSKFRIFRKMSHKKALKAYKNMNYEQMMSYLKPLTADEFINI